MDSNPSNTQLPVDTEYICNMLYETLKVPVYFMDNQDVIIYSFANDQVPNPLYENKVRYFIQIFQNTEYDTEPVIRSGQFLENYISISLLLTDEKSSTNEQVYQGRFILGPSTPFYITTAQMDDLMNKHQIPFNRKRVLTTFLHAMPVIEYRRLISISQIIYYLAYHKHLDIPKLLEKSSAYLDITAQIHHQYALTVSSNRIQTFFHHSMNHENQVLQCIREGNIQQLKKVAYQALDGQNGTLSKTNPLRGQKNLEICLVTLATRAAIEGGLHAEKALTLSDLYIQEIEITNDIKDLHLLSNQMIYDFTNQVRQLKEATYSKTIAMSLQIISDQLYEPLTISSLATAVGLSTHYFAARFKKEMGVPVMTYIQNEKTEEAKRLLTSSNFSLLEISNILGFHDQSHFTKLFQKRTGMTPRKYRER